MNDPRDPIFSKTDMPPPYVINTPNPPPYYPDLSTAGMQPPTPAPQLPRTQVIGHRPAGTKLGPGPSGMTCPTCSAQIVTKVEYAPNNKTHIVSAVLCVVAGCCCGCLIPYCMKSCKTTNHYCPACSAFIGSHVPS